VAGPTVIGAATPHLPPPRIHAPATNPRSGADQGQMYSTVVFRGVGRCPVWGANVGSRDVNWRGWLMDDTLLQCPQRCWSYVASFQLQLTAKTRSCCNQHADAAANIISVVSTFTPAMFSPADIHKPHAAQPDLLLLLLLCDLSSPLCGRTEIAV